MGVVRIVGLAFFVALLVATSTADEEFKCGSQTTCRAIVDYISPNNSAISAIQRLFNVSDLTSILGANNLRLSTNPSAIISANQTIRIPFPCRCARDDGASDGTPYYTVVPNDTLSHIAEKVFSRLVTVDMIKDANNIPDANRINIGQKLLIPLPCSCDDGEAGQKVIHLGQVVARGSSISEIARRYNVSERTLLIRNDLDNPQELMAGVALDIPLPVCTSMVGSNSLDYPLLTSNGTYILTANNCVKCKCDAANNWTLQCEPSQIKPTVWGTCPPMQCQGSENLYLGNVTTTSNCNRTTCSYAGYTNQAILTTVTSDSTCPNNGSSNGNGNGDTVPGGPGPSNSAVRFGLQGSPGWGFLVSIYLVLFPLLF